MCRKSFRNWSYRALPGRKIAQCEVCGKKHRVGTKDRLHLVRCQHYKGGRKPGSGGSRHRTGMKKPLQTKKSIPITFELRVTQWDRLIAIANERKMTFSELFRTMIDEQSKNVIERPKNHPGKKKTNCVSIFKRHHHWISEKAEMLCCSKSQVIQEVVRLFLENCKESF